MRHLLLAAALVIALLATGCSGNRSPERLPANPTAPPDLGNGVIIQMEPLPVTKQMEGRTGIVQMVVTERGFEPGALASTIGEMVKVHLRNTGTKPHNFIVPAFGIVTSSLAPGAENYIEFPASQKGDWPFFSDAPGQEEPGLRGTLKVE